MDAFHATLKPSPFVFSPSSQPGASAESILSLLAAPCDAASLAARIDRIERTLARMEASQQQILCKLDEVLDAVRMQASVLAGVLEGDSECPRYLLMLPEPPAGSPAAKDAYTLQFVDPVTMMATGKGFPVKDHAVKDCAPALSVGLGALTMLSEASANRERRFGLPVGKEDGRDERAVLHEAYAEVKASLAQASMTHVTVVNDEVLAGRLPRNALPTEYVEAIQTGYSAVTDLLDRLQKGKSWEQQLNDPFKCGLVKAVHRTDGIEWVKAEYRVLYELKGRAILGKPVAELSTLRSSAERAACRIQGGRRGAIARKWAARLFALKSRCESRMCEALVAAAEQARLGEEPKILEGQRKIQALEMELAQQDDALRHEVSLTNTTALRANRAEEEVQVAIAAVKQAEVEKELAHAALRHREDAMAAQEARFLKQAEASSAAHADELGEVQRILANARVELASAKGENQELAHIVSTLSKQLAAVSRRR